MESAIEKLKKRYSSSRTGGKGSVRRKRKNKKCKFKSRISPEEK